ncbi:hypothetical protein C8R46DRAFT_1044832 [Mycena filopes]|nr:hypothetical protein C8R46DRAFT_1044832 [Mycena filopes]
MSKPPNTIGPIPGPIKSIDQIDTNELPLTRRTAAIAPLKLFPSIKEGQSISQPSPNFNLAPLGLRKMFQTIIEEVDFQLTPGGTTPVIYHLSDKLLNQSKQKIEEGIVKINEVLIRIRDESQSLKAVYIPPCTNDEIISLRYLDPDPQALKDHSERQKQLSVQEAPMFPPKLGDFSRRRDGSGTPLPIGSGAAPPDGQYTSPGPTPGF